MKLFLTAIIALFSVNLNAQTMNNPSDVVIKLFVSTDNRDWEAVENTFNSTVLLDYSSMTGNPATQLSPEQIIDSWKTILPGFESTHHQLGNFQSQTNGAKANVTCYGTATHFLTDDDGNTWTVVGTYDFALNQNPSGSWKISSMKFNFKYQDGNSKLAEKAINNLK